MVTLRRCPAWFLALGLLATATPAPAAEIDRLLPDNVQSLCTIQVAQLLHSPLIKKYALDQIKTTLKDSEPVQQCFEALGFDPFKDVSRVVLAATGEDDMLAIVHGHFDTARIDGLARRCARCQCGPIKIHKTAEGQVIYEIKGGEPEEGKKGSVLFGWPCFGGEEPPSFLPCVSFKGSLFFTLVDKTTVVLTTSSEAAGDVLVRAADKKRPALSPEMRRLLKSVDTKATVWAIERTVEQPKAGDAEESEDESDAPPPCVKEEATEEGCGIDGYSASLNVEDDVRIKVTLYTPTSEGAVDLLRDLGDLRTRVYGLSLLLAGNQKEMVMLKDVPRSIQMNRHGRVVTVEGHITATLIDKIGELFEQE